MLINDLDTEKSQGMQISRVPFLELECLYQKKSLEMRGIKEHGLELANRMEGRRLIRSHLPLEFLPPDLLEKCKVVYVARNPKDACVSYYHHNLSLPNHCFTGNFQQFADLFEDGLHAYGSYWHHLLGGWAVRDHPNVKIVWFEAEWNTLIGRDPSRYCALIASTLICWHQGLCHYYTSQD